jgi:hypothetical protein
MKFEYGQTVRVKATAPELFRPGQMVSVCGERIVESKEIAKAFGEPVGTVLCLVEFSDGQAVEVPERWLESEKC